MELIVYCLMHITIIIIIFLQLQRYISAPTEQIKEDGSVVYESCKMFDLNYSAYSRDELLNWDRDSMVDNMTQTIDCQAWVYDQSVMSRTIVSDVCTNDLCFTKQYISRRLICQISYDYFRPFVFSTNFGQKLYKNMLFLYFYRFLYPSLSSQTFFCKRLCWANHSCGGHLIVSLSCVIIHDAN